MHGREFLAESRLRMSLEWHLFKAVMEDIATPPSSFSSRPGCSSYLRHSDDFVVLQDLDALLNEGKAITRR